MTFFLLAAEVRNVFHQPINDDAKHGLDGDVLHIGVSSPIHYQEETLPVLV